MIRGFIAEAITETWPECMELQTERAKRNSLAQLVKKHQIPPFKDARGRDVLNLDLTDADAKKLRDNMSMLVRDKQRTMENVHKKLRPIIAKVEARFQ